MLRASGRRLLTVQAITGALAALAASAPANATDRDGATEADARTRDIFAFYMFRSWASPSRLRRLL